MFERGRQRPEQTVEELAPSDFDSRSLLQCLDKGLVNRHWSYRSENVFVNNPSLPMWTDEMTDELNRKQFFPKTPNERIRGRSL